MRCYRVRRKLSAYIDDEVDPRGRASIESHLAGCKSCSSELTKLRAQGDVLVGAEQPPALPGKLWPDILAALDAVAQLPWHRRHREMLLRAICVAACVVLGFAGGAYFTWRQPAVASAPDGVPIGERMMVAEAFGSATFGLSEKKEGLLRCVPE